MIETEVLILAAISALIILVLTILLFIRRSSETIKTNDIQDVPDDAPAVRQRPVQVQDAGPIRNRTAASRNARARMRMAQAQRQQHDEAPDVEEEIGEVGEEISLPEGKIGKKKLAKLQMKAEKKALREQEEKERKEKKERDKMLEKIQKAEEEKQEKEKTEREEEERKKREEEERREQEEYENMKLQFAVEEEGFDETTDQDEQNLLTNFITHIQKSKVVILENLASQFKLKTQDVIDRITTLQKEGRLTGVLDDRGKFIYITQSELESVANFIRQRGRISLSDLAEASNSLINLTPIT